MELHQESEFAISPTETFLSWLLWVPIRMKCSEEKKYCLPMRNTPMLRIIIYEAFWLLEKIAQTNVRTRKNIKETRSSTRKY